VRAELERVRAALEQCAGCQLSDDDLRSGIRIANRVRSQIGMLRHLVFSAPICPLPALEMLIAEMLAIHFCSDREESLRVVDQLIAEVTQRIRAAAGVLSPDAVRVFWVNPVADLRVMNLLEDAGGRVCGTEFMFSHALDPLPQDVPPMRALAMAALADPMVGSAVDRAERVCADIRRWDAEALVISRIPGASHCAMEGIVIGDIVRQRLGIPVVELEVPSITDAMEPTLRTRLEALLEMAYERREP
jgi:benzoyl-CoA reductase/2-hydroxyglutaryl-CoA dehydratase subunit BcrC/BadD/HgdB